MGRVIKSKTKTKQHISYEGAVIVKIQKGKRILSSKVYHNAGTTKLFRFLCDCLKQNYNKNEAPSRIRLFRILEGETVDNPQWVDAATITPLLSYDTTPVITADTDACNITFHFRIPYAYLTSDSGVYKMALYNSTAENIDPDKMAYFLFVNEAGDNWEPLTIAGRGSSYSIIIE